MNRHKHDLLAITLFAAALMATAMARADSVLIQRVRQERSMDLPGRGLSMAEVERRYGAPVAKLEPRGGGRPRQPVIQRWRYAHFIVFFERDRVIHSVLDTPAAAR